MAINWRLGLRRSAIGLAAIFWLFAILFSVGYGGDAAYVDPQAIPPPSALVLQDGSTLPLSTKTAPGERTRIADPSGREWVVRARDLGPSILAVHVYQTKQAKAASKRLRLRAMVQSLGFSAAIFALLVAMYFGLRWVVLGFLAKPRQQA